MADETHISAEDRKDILGLVLGAGLAVVALALPLAFDLPVIVTRAIFCIGAAISIWSLRALFREHFVRLASNPHARLLRDICVSAATFVSGVVVLTIAALAPQPVNYGPRILSALEGITQSPRPAPMSADDVAKRVVAMMPKAEPEIFRAPQSQPGRIAPVMTGRPAQMAAVDCKTEFPYISANYSGTKDNIADFGIGISLSGRLRQHNVAFEFMSMTKDKPMIQPQDFTSPFLDPGSQGFSGATSLFEFGDYTIHIRSDECDLWERLSLIPTSNKSFRQEIAIREDNKLIKTFVTEGVTSPN